MDRESGAQFRTIQEGLDVAARHHGCLKGLGPNEMCRLVVFARFSVKAEIDSGDYDTVTKLDVREWCRPIVSMRLLQGQLLFDLNPIEGECNLIGYNGKDFRLGPDSRFGTSITVTVEELKFLSSHPATATPG